MEQRLIMLTWMWIWNINLKNEILYMKTSKEDLSSRVTGIAHESMLDASTDSCSSAAGWSDSNVPPMVQGCVAPARVSPIEVVEREREAEGDPQRTRQGKKDERGWDGGWKYLDIREGMNKTKLYPQCCLRGRRALNSLNKLAESSEIFPSRRSTECGENSSPPTDFAFFSF